MKRRPLLWQLFPSYLILAMVSFVLVLGYATLSFRKFYDENTASGLKAKVEPVKSQIARRLEAQNYRSLQWVAEDLAIKSGATVRIIVPGGAVVADTNKGVYREVALNPTDLQMALKWPKQFQVQYNAKRAEMMMDVAVPITDNDRIRGVVMMSLPITVIEATFRDVYLHLVPGSLILVMLAIIVSLAIAHRIGKPMEKLRHHAEQVSAGNSGQIPPLEGAAEELYLLGDTMNTLLEQFRVRLQSTQDLAAVLDSVGSGIVLVGLDQTLIYANDWVAPWLRFEVDKAIGKSLQEVFRQFDVIRLVEGVLASGNTGAVELLGPDSQTHYSATATVFSKHNHLAGVVVILHDVTRLKQLEAARRQFVANVSHELKTPITAIKGALETLHDAPSDADRVKFLTMAQRHTDRLGAIVDDLLALAAIENEKEAMVLEPQKLAPILKAALEANLPLAQQQNRILTLSCEDHLEAALNARLFEQAIINLLDNALKYSEADVQLKAESLPDGGVSVTVQDQGAGIESEHLPHLFERFYRIDKSRNRAVGGTGLGLAIVKHIVQAHNGSIEVKSEVGKGSQFTVNLP
ncbi:MAG: sensor histidine kinase [Candidatus Margulisiibacteriota bacterium]